MPELCKRPDARKYRSILRVRYFCEDVESRPANKANREGDSGRLFRYCQINIIEHLSKVSLMFIAIFNRIALYLAQMPSLSTANNSWQFGYRKSCYLPFTRERSLRASIFRIFKLKSSFSVRALATTFSNRSHHTQLSKCGFWDRYVCP